MPGADDLVSGKSELFAKENPNPCRLRLPDSRPRQPAATGWARQPSHEGDQMNILASMGGVNGEAISKDGGEDFNRAYGAGDQVIR